MNTTNSYHRFKELRQEYYIAGRALLINRLFDVAGINFGYAIELSLKFLLIFNKETKALYNHDIEEYYKRATESKYIPQLNVSSDFLKFANERLNSRYPSMIKNNQKAHEKESRVDIFTIDMLHCYDDFILQLDDAITAAVGNPRSSIGFRCCRELLSTTGRIFFHCNDHAFQRIDAYLKLLHDNRVEGDNLNELIPILLKKDGLWNFKGLIAYRPWGPKENWQPASQFSFSDFSNDQGSLKAAKWAANNTDADMYLSSMKFSLPKGKYAYNIKTVVKTEDT